MGTLAQCVSSRMMVRTLKLVLVGMTLAQNLVNAKNYLIETEDQPEEYGTEYGSDYGAPVPYGGTQVVTQEWVVPTRHTVTCSWSQYMASSKFQGPCGGTSTQTWGRHCTCSDGSTGTPAMCGGGNSSKTKTVQNPPCQEQHQHTTKRHYAPKPYRHKKRH